MSPKMLKDTALSLAEPFTYIIDRSLTESMVPDKLKIAKALPVFKSVSKKLMDSYRPIFTPTAVSQIFERVVYDKL